MIDVLIRLAGDPDTDVAREAAVGLGRSGDARGGAAIVAFLNAHPDERDAVLAALQQNSGSPGLSVVITTATDPQMRATATRLLRELQDPDGVAAFQRVLQTVPADTTDEVQRGMRRNAIFGLAEIGDASAADGLMELAQRPLTPGARVDPNADMDARLALDALRKIPGAPARAKATLLAMLPRADFMRTQILLALGAGGDASIGSQLMTYLANDQSQEGAAVAVCRLGYAPGVTRVRADMVRPAALHMNEETVQDEPVFIKRRNAIRGIGWAHDQRLAQDLMRIVEDPLDRAALREEAGFALASLANDATLEQIANARARYVEVRGHPALLPLRAAHARDPCDRAASRGCVPARGCERSRSPRPRRSQPASAVTTRLRASCVRCSRTPTRRSNSTRVSRRCSAPTKPRPTRCSSNSVTAPSLRV